jgi:hypothetical protein
VRAPCSPLTLTVCVDGNGGGTGAPRGGLDGSGLCLLLYWKGPEFLYVHIGGLPSSTNLFMRPTLTLTLTLSRRAHCPARSASVCHVFVVLYVFCYPDPDVLRPQTHVSCARICVPKGASETWFILVVLVVCVVCSVLLLFL